MFNELSPNEIQTLIDGELGINVVRFMEIVESMGNNNIFVDIGVETGKSSKILLNKAIQKNNKVFGIDPIQGMEEWILKNPKYTYIKGDSVETGKNWLQDKVSIVFVDSVHIKPQVMCELKYWWNLVKEGGWIIFHDTNWSWVDESGNRQYYIHKANHNCAGKKAGNRAMGCDTYAGVNWPTPDYAVKEFFNINSLNFENDIIKSTNGPESLGMTFIQKKKNYDYSKNIPDFAWEQYEKDRQEVLKCFK